MSKDEEEEETEFRCPECDSKFIIETGDTPSDKMSKILDKAIEKSSLEIYCQTCEEFVEISGDVEDPDLLVEGEDCTECGAKFAMKVETGLSEMYLGMFKQGMEKYDYSLYCQVCEEMRDPEQEVTEL